MDKHPKRDPKTLIGSVQPVLPPFDPPPPYEPQQQAIGSFGSLPFSQQQPNVAEKSSVVLRPDSLHQPAHPHSQWLPTTVSTKVQPESYSKARLLVAILFYLYLLIMFMIFIRVFL